PFTHSTGQNSIKYISVIVLNLQSGLDSHNIYSKKGYTVKYRPWKVIHTENYANKKEAMNREKQLKTAKGREFIWNLVKNSTQL
ncbi:MAG: GIY-YIG nuclease family protein, partial [Bacteroidota bacterium]